MEDKQFTQQLLVNAWSTIAEADIKNGFKSKDAALLTIRQKYGDTIAQEVEKHL